MCKKCVQVVKTLCKELWEIVSFPQTLNILATSKVLPTRFYTGFPALSHKLTANNKQMRLPAFPTISTPAITTTILINNKEVAGRRGTI